MSKKVIKESFIRDTIVETMTKVLREGMGDIENDPIERICYKMLTSLSPEEKYDLFEYINANDENAGDFVSRIVNKVADDHAAMQNGLEMNYTEHSVAWVDGRRSCVITDEAHYSQGGWNYFYQGSRESGVLGHGFFPKVLMTDNVKLAQALAKWWSEHGKVDTGDLNLSDWRTYMRR